MCSIGGEGRTAHVLVIPHNAQGHTVPMLRFTKELARKGVIITFVAYDDTISSLTSEDLSAELQSLDFRFIGLHKNSPGKVADTVVQISQSLEKAFEPVFQKLVHDKNSGVAGPTSILSDFFFNWAQDVADKLQIPRYLFIPSGAIFARFIQGYLDLYTQDRIQISETDGKLVKFDGSVCVPGLPPLKYHEFVITAREYPAHFLARSQKMWRTAGVVVNSCYEVEEQAIDSWRSPGTPEFEQRKVPKIYPVGPFFSTTVNIPSIIKVVNGLEDSADESLLWLGSQPSSSVVYVAFGTHARLSPGQINELAHGLEASNQRFLWVIPQSKISSEEGTWTSVTDLLPPDFEARVGDRGCIVTGWAPQLQILAHSSTAVFLTHAGWNSSFESIMMGVPMIAWPQGAEQHLNCRFLTDHLKIADELQTGGENILDRKEVERAVRLLMVESEGKAMKRRTEELQRKAAGAVREGGSQSTAFEEFVHDLFSR